MSKQAKLTNNLKRNLIHTLQKPEKAQVSSIIPEVAYLPGFGKYGKKRPLEDKLIPYAAACIEKVREFNERAALLYKKILEVCKEPECQAIFTILLSDTARQPDDASRLLETLRCEGPSERAGKAMGDHMQGHNWPPELFKAMDDFVLHGFNRDDLESPKVVLNNSPALYFALGMNAIFDTVAGNQAEDIRERIKAGTVADLFGNDPKTRPERRRKAKSIESLHQLGCGEVNKQTLLLGATLWYKARVNPGTLAEACNELHLNYLPFYSTKLEPYDLATGYRLA